MGKKNTEETLPDETDKLVREILKGCDGVIGGFPCQDISVAGKRAGILRDSAGEAASRSGLFWEMVRIVCMVRPRYWLMENVAELLSGHLGTVLEAVAASGYDAEWDCVAASTVGAPHHRGRIYLLAYPVRSSGDRRFPQKICRQPEFQRYESCRGIQDIARMSDISEPIFRRNPHGAAKRLHGIGNANPPCVIRELTRGLS
jgi:DNA (cytosine-5)-methyltransferase 1